MYGTRVKGEWGMGVRAGFAALVMAIGLGVTTAPAFAQGTAKPAAKPAAPAAAPAAKDEKDKNFWVKLCEKAPSMADPKKELKMCVTHHEQLAPNGMVLVSVAIRQIEGQDKEGLMVMVPLGVLLRPGVLFKIEEEGKPMELPFSLCHPIGCTAEVEATKEIMEKLKKAKQVAVGTMDLSGKPVFFRIPMNGFEKTLAGPAADSEKYKEERKRIMMAIRERQKELAKKQEEEQKNGKAAPAPEKQK